MASELYDTTDTFCVLDSIRQIRTKQIDPVQRRFAEVRLFHFLISHAYKVSRLRFSIQGYDAEQVAADSAYKFFHHYVENQEFPFDSIRKVLSILNTITRTQRSSVLRRINSSESMTLHDRRLVMHTNLVDVNWDVIPSREADPSDEFMDAELWDSCFQKLRCPNLRAVLLYRVQGLTRREIASIMNVDCNQVRRWIRLIAAHHPSPKPRNKKQETRNKNGEVSASKVPRISRKSKFSLVRDCLLSV